CLGPRWRAASTASYAAGWKAPWAGFGVASHPTVGRVRLNKEASALLGRARIGMLVLRSGRTPLVNPAAFSYTSGALWMTTSRFAAKTVLARRDPRAAFFVDGGARAVVLRGTMEVFDPIS